MGVRCASCPLRSLRAVAPALEEARRWAAELSASSAEAAGWARACVAGGVAAMGAGRVAVRGVKLGVEVAVVGGLFLGRGQDVICFADLDEAGRGGGVGGVFVRVVEFGEGEELAG